MLVGSHLRRFASANGAHSGRAFVVGLATLLLILLPVAANAYTLVLRSGRHVAVPDDFKVTPAAVIYEAAPGISATVRLSNIDIAATERANAEPAGSFATRIGREPAQGVAVKPPAPVKTERRAGAPVVTNKELEPLRLRREAQEAEYERTHRERGLPSWRELQQYFEEQDRGLHEAARQIEEEREAAELESVRAELANVRQELDELGLHLSRQVGTYIPAYAYPYYYYAPPVQLITHSPFIRRGGFGHAKFGLRPRAGIWHYNVRQGLYSPTPRRSPFNRITRPRAPAPLMPTPRR